MAATQATPYRTVDGAVVMRRVGWRIVPFLVLCYFIAYVDRVNAGFAALTMNKDLGLSQAMFGIGGGLFFAPTCCSRCRATSRWRRSARGSGSRAS